VRGRGLRRPLPDGQQPDFGLYLTARQPEISGWPSHWLRWPDFGLPLDRAAAVEAIAAAWTLAASQRVEVACGGGVGRTGTVLACLAVMDGVPAQDAVDYVRHGYCPRAVETPWQRRYVRNFKA
jgi:protein-tyrosine phosphatase